MVAAAAAEILIIFGIVTESLTKLGFWGLIVINLAAFFVGKSAPARRLTIFA